MVEDFFSFAEKTWSGKKGVEKEAYGTENGEGEGKVRGRHAIL